MIYFTNDITREATLRVVKIMHDGWFEAKFLVSYPQFVFLELNKLWKDVYMEPGATTGMVVNWDEFLLADRIRNIRYQFKDIEYFGIASRLMKEKTLINVKRFALKRSSASSW